MLIEIITVLKNNCFTQSNYCAKKIFISLKAITVLIKYLFHLINGIQMSNRCPAIKPLKNKHT